MILKTPTGKIQKGNYQVLQKRQVNKTALKRMCDEDDSNKSPSKYQKAEKIIVEKSSIMQELDDLQELDVEVSPLPTSPLPNIKGGGPRVVVSTAAFHARVWGSVPGPGGLKETKNVSSPSTCDREVACSASDSQGLNFESCVWRTVSSQSSHHPQGVLLAQFSLYVHKSDLKPDSFHFLT